MKYKKLALALLAVVSAFSCAFAFSACGKGNAKCEHTYGEPVDLISNCTDHVVSKSCTKCGDMQVTTAPIKAHTVGVWSCDDANHWYTCSVCHNEVGKAQHKTNAQNVCTDCGFVKGATAGFEFTLYNGYFALSGIGKATVEDIVIPSYYQGLPIKEIGERAFNSFDRLKSVIIPGTVKNIGKEAFCYCTGLTGVTIREGVKSIGEKAFESCSSLKSITIPNGVTSIGDNAFYHCTGLTSITIPDSVTSIGYYAFEGSNDLMSITFNGTVAQWKAIQKDEWWISRSCDYTLTCTDGKLDRDGNPITA